MTWSIAYLFGDGQSPASLLYLIQIASFIVLGLFIWKFYELYQSTPPPPEKFPYRNQMVGLCIPKP